LLIEDPRVLDGNLAATLKREPNLVVVGQTSSPDECRQFADGEERLNVAIVDLFLPDNQGTSLIEGLRRSCPHTPLLVLTASLDPHGYEQAVQAGADAVLGKDTAPEEIAATVERLSSN
jgi:DNA-binding NarL/FixJ family response regulator